jgi:hypothetical protein
VLGAPELAADVRAAIVKGVHDEVQSRSLGELAAYRDEVVLGLISMRTGESQPVAP